MGRGTRALGFVLCPLWPRRVGVTGAWCRRGQKRTGEDSGPPSLISASHVHLCAPLTPRGHGRAAGQRLLEWSDANQGPARARASAGRGLPEGEWGSTCLACVPHTPSPQHTHLEYGYHIHVGVQQEGGEFRVGAWPGQHGHHKARCHLERAKRGCGQCRAPPAHRLSPHRAPGSPPPSDSPGPARGLSPQERPQQPLGTQRVLGLLLPTQASPGPGGAWGHRQRWAQAPKRVPPFSTQSHTPQRHLYFCPQGRSFGPVSNTVWEAR